jgi:hypothetical protein
MPNTTDEFVPVAQMIARLEAAAANAASQLGLVRQISDTDAQIDLANSITDALIRALAEWTGDPADFKQVVDSLLPE